MQQRIEHAHSTYGPMQFKTFEGALGSFFANECPQLGGERTRQVLVQLIADLIGRFYPQTSPLRRKFLLKKWDRTAPAFVFGSGADTKCNHVLA